MRPMQDTRALVKALGGSTAVGSKIGANRDAVRAWYRIGVPYRHWPAVKALAAEAEIEGVDDAFLAATKQPSAQPTERAA